MARNGIRALIRKAMQIQNFKLAAELSANLLRLTEFP